MATCFRCDVEGLIVRYGRTKVIEVIGQTDENGRPRYHIFIPVRPTSSLSPDSRVIQFGGALYVWALTGFSLNHSLDGDCWHPNRKEPGCGFPTHRPWEQPPLVDFGPTPEPSLTEAP